MQDNNLTPEQRRMLAFERGESLEADKKKAEISDYQKQQAAQWEQMGAEFTKSDTKKADSLEAAGLRNPDAVKSGWDAIADEYANKKPNHNDSDNGDAKAEKPAKQPIQVEQTAEAVQPDPSASPTVEKPAERVDSPEASSGAIATSKPAEVAEPTNSLTADAEQEIALAKRGAVDQSTYMKSNTLQHLQNRYGAENVQSLEMTSDESAQYNDMLAQASRVGNDTDNPTSINAITGVNKADGDYSQFGKTVDSNGLGGLMADANRATSGNSLNNQLTIGQMRVATAAGRESEMNVAGDVEAVDLLDEKPYELPQNPVELTNTSKQLDEINDHTDKTGFDPGGRADDRAEDNLDDARAEVEIALKAQEEVDKQKSQAPSDFDLAA